ncbi:hypothetical protein Tco_1457939 [Tanacetum coccineum]
MMSPVGSIVAKPLEKSRELLACATSPDLLDSAQILKQGRGHPIIMLQSLKNLFFVGVDMPFPTRMIPACQNKNSLEEENPSENLALASFWQEILESGMLDAFIREDEWSILLEKMSHWSGYFGKILYESLDNALFDIKALLPVKTQIGVFTSLQHFLKTGEAIFKGIPKDREVIHEDFHCLFNHVVKDGQHTPLERARSEMNLATIGSKPEKDFRLKYQQENIWLMDLDYETELNKRRLESRSSLLAGGIVSLCFDLGFCMFLNTAIVGCDICDIIFQNMFLQRLVVSEEHGRCRAEAGVWFFSDRELALDDFKHSRGILSMKLPPGSCVHDFLDPIELREL